MTVHNFFWGILCVLGISSGQILFKMASKQMALGTISTFVLRLFYNYYLMIGLFIYVVTTVLWIALLRVVDLKEAYPIMALAFIFVPILANWFLGEKIDYKTFLGGAFIIIGIVVGSR